MADRKPVKTDDGSPVNSQEDEDLLKECREDFTYCKSYWNENYQEAARDMDCVLCVPPEEFTADRAGRPCIWPDELSQYVNQTNNNLRQNKRSIRVSPRSLEAKDVDAEHRQAYIRGIEYASKAQSIYTTAFESAVECAFGFWRVKLIVTGPNGEQEPRIRRIPNWATVYMDPDAKEADFSDSNLAFVTDTMRVSTFRLRYPKAKKKSFSGTDYEVAPGWLNGQDITVAEWWKREEHEDADGEKTYKVTQRITNGFEILETNEWIGSWIPIIGVFGLEKFKRNGSSSKRIFLSLVRRARAAQQMLAYIASQEAEEFGMAPRAPYLVLEGTVDPQEWKHAHKVPVAYLSWKMPNDWNPAASIDPRPQRQQFTPNIEAYQVARESWRRAVQAAMGITPLPTAAQRNNEKSGIALERIQTQESIGAFHFIDNYVRALSNTGIQLNELITKLAELDSLPSQVLGKDQKDEDRILHIVPRGQDRPANSEHLPEADFFFAHRGQFEVTAADGPNHQSEREEASEFADTLLQALPSMGMPPALIQAVLAIAVKLKNIGTYGDEIADLLQPPDPNNIDPKAKALLMQAQAQVQTLTAELNQLKMEKAGKVMGEQAKTQRELLLADKDAAVRMTEADKDRETKVLVAEITTKAQQINERMAAFEDMMQQFHQQAHELALAMQQQKHEKEVAAAAAQNAAAQQATQIAAEQQSAAEEPAN